MNFKNSIVNCFCCTKSKISRKTNHQITRKTLYHLVMENHWNCSMITKGSVCSKCVGSTVLVRIIYVVKHLQRHRRCLHAKTLQRTSTVTVNFDSKVLLCEHNNAKGAWQGMSRAYDITTVVQTNNLSFKIHWRLCIAHLLFAHQFQQNCSFRFYKYRVGLPSNKNFALSFQHQIEDW